MPIELLSTNTAVLKIMIDVRRLLLRDGERGGARSALNEATHDQRSVAQPLFRRLLVENTGDRRSGLCNRRVMPITAFQHRLVKVKAYFP
jgi:hypothetical protein